MQKVVIKKLTKEEISKKEIFHWPIWEKEVSRFDWEYTSEEECLILEGEVDIETAEGLYKIKPGDFVTFKNGLNCVWNVKKKIRKHYNFK